MIVDTKVLKRIFFRAEVQKYIHIYICTSCRQGLLTILLISILIPSLNRSNLLTSDNKNNPINTTIMTDRICISGKVRNVNWTSLPVDIHDLILKSLAQHRRLASYATVCKEWQASIEKKNFDRLKLGQSCLDEFERIAKRKGKLIKHIWLNIELLQYTCQTCRLIETDRWTRKNNDIISESISRLFSILHTCMPTNNSGLTLELNAYSPSDQKHWFKGCYFGAHGEDEVLESDLQSQENGVARDDLAHDWRNGWELELTGLNDRAIQRPFEEIGLRFLGELPQVEAVTKFVLRRQCRRQWDPSTLKHLWEKLPRLEHIVYEPWQAWDETSQRAKFDRGMLSYLCREKIQRSNIYITCRLCETDEWEPANESQVHICI